MCENDPARGGSIIGTCGANCHRITYAGGTFHYIGAGDAFATVVSARQYNCLTKISLEFRHQTARQHPQLVLPENFWARSEVRSPMQ